MLIGGPSTKPNLQSVRRIKRALREALQLPDDAILTVTQLACLEKDCAPVETVIGLLRPSDPKRQHTVHKSTDSIDAEDLVRVCEAWGHPVTTTAFESFYRREQ